MKQRILIFCTVLSALGLTAFGMANWKGEKIDRSETAVTSKVELYSQNVEKVAMRPFPDFVHDVGPRLRPIKKGHLDAARSIDDFFDEEELGAMTTLKSVSIIVIKDERPSKIRETGSSKALTTAQLKLLQSFDYSTNFFIRADYQKMIPETGAFVDDYVSPYLTIVPEKLAEYAHGKDALLDYLKENSKEAFGHVQTDQLRPAKLYFTVTKKGSIENVRLDNHSGYPEVDKTMIELLSKVPGTWVPAENTKGEKVNQELVLSFGTMGC